MSANIYKNGVANCTPIDGYDKVSILKNDIVVGENLFGFNKGVKIGSLHANSSVVSNPDEYGYTINITSDSAGISCRVQNLGFNGVAGETYTFSADIYASSDCSAHFDICDKGATTFDLTTEKKRYSFSATPTNYYNSSTGYNGFCDIETTNCSGIVIYLSNVKIERGSKATPWCPSPSDGFGNTPPTYKNPIQARDFIEL